MFVLVVDELYSFTWYGPVGAGHNCHDNAVAETFFSLLREDQIKGRIYPRRAAASSDIFDYIEIFCNPVRRHDLAADLSPVERDRHSVQTGY
ncbi:transposase InsO family protein [Luteibacter sp. 1214]|nr:transposase InsO family protein [Luteibacter sp. 1214]